MVIRCIDEASGSVIDYHGIARIAHGSQGTRIYRGIQGMTNEAMIMH